MAIKIRHNTLVFKEAARALGARRAKRELLRVAECRAADLDQDAGEISSSFFFNQTPQGSAFWFKVVGWY